MRLQGATFNDLLAVGAGWLVVVCSGWVVMICLAAGVERATAGRLRATSWVACPPALRRALLAGLGAALVTAPTQASAGTSPSGLTPGASQGTERPSPPPLPVPARPLGGATHGRTHLVVVRPGDVLWRLAEDRLPGSAPAQAVAALVERLHHRNRALIGPDPDLIRPGERLVLPPRNLRGPTPHPQEKP